MNITEAEAARILGITPSCLNILRKKQEGPPFYPGRLPGVPGAHRGYYKLHEVTRWSKKRQWSAKVGKKYPRQ